jgi:hypothetical protein
MTDLIIAKEIKSRARHLSAISHSAISHTGKQPKSTWRVPQQSGSCGALQLHATCTWKEWAHCLPYRCKELVSDLHTWLASTSYTLYCRDVCIVHGLSPGPTENTPWFLHSHSPPSHSLIWARIQKFYGHTSFHTDAKSLCQTCTLGLLALATPSYQPSVSYRWMHEM